MEEKWWAIGIIGVVLIVHLYNAAEAYITSQVKIECYKAVVVAIQNKVQPLKCERGWQ